MSLRKQIGNRARPYPWLYRILVGVWNGAFAFAALARSLRFNHLFFAQDKTYLTKVLGQQTVETHVVGILVTTTDEFRAWCDQHNLTYCEGGWTFYLPPSPILAQFMPFLAERYPRGAGLKILKDFQAPHKAHYTRHNINPATGASLLRRLTPPPKALLRVANFMSDRGLGPKVYDLIELRTEGASLTAYVVQGLTGGQPTALQHTAFMKRLKAVLAKGDIATALPNIATADDFRFSENNRNLLLDCDSDNALFVDFQAFYLPDEARLLRHLSAEIQDTTHFGGTRFHRTKSYLYQSFPGVATGKRDVERRWKEFQILLDDATVSLEGRLIYDIGCNTGLMLYGALAQGAAWGFGWDRRAVALAAQRVLHAFGATRFDIFGNELHAESDFASALPSRFTYRTGGILMYLAMSEHIGFPRGLADLSWQYMIYEGHANQDLSHARNQISTVPWLSTSLVISERWFGDGDSPARPILLLARDGA